MIHVCNLSKRFGPVVAVDDVSFAVERNEVVGFLGPNGAGKSTTMRILTGYLPATQGTVEVAGFDVDEDSLAVRRNIGYLPESVPLYGEMRVEEYVHFRAKLKGVPRRERIARVDYCLERCRLKEVRRRLVQTLSKGYRQRVGLADAMVHDPPILILDEPTSGLDPAQIRETLALIGELGEKRTVLLSTHILAEVEAICTRAIVIAAGKLKMDASVASIEADTSVLTEVKAPEAEALAAFGAIAGVRGASALVTEDGWLAVTVAASGPEATEAIGAVVAGRGWPLRRLERKRRQLEQAYFDAIRVGRPGAGNDVPRTN